MGQLEDRVKAPQSILSPDPIYKPKYGSWTLMPTVGASKRTLKIQINQASKPKE